MQSEAWPSVNNYDSMINEGFTLEMKINSHRKNGSIKGIQTYIAALVDFLGCFQFSYMEIY